MAVSFLVSSASLEPALSGLAYFKQIASDTRQAYQDRFAKSKSINREVENFKTQAKKVATPQEFVDNYRLLSFATSAFGIEDAMQYGYRTKKILLSDPSDPYSLLNKFTEPRYREMNVAFGFGSGTTANLQDDGKVDLIVKSYYKNEYEQSLAALNPNLDDAAYFIRKIGEITDMNQLISDQTIFGVVIDTLGISRSGVGNDLVQLKKQIGAKFDISRVKDKAYIEQFAKRYLALKDIETRKNTQSPLMGLFESSYA